MSVAPVGCSPAIDLVEAAYRLDLAESAWLDAIAAAALPELDRGAGVIAYTADPRTQAVRVLADQHATPAVLQLLQRLNDHAPPEVKEAVRGGGLRGLYTLSEKFFHIDALREGWPQLVHPYDYEDGIVLLAREPDHMVTLWAPSRHRLRLIPRVRDMWSQVTTHITTARRLRSVLAARAHAVAQGAEAIVDTKGRIHHAEGVAQHRNAQHSLRDAVLGIERARGPLRRRDPGAALALWAGLVQGRWSLVDYFDHDGRRFFAAHPNPPGTHDPRALRERELSVLRLAREGLAPKEIAYALGISDSNARAVLSAALKKLGLEGRHALGRYMLADAAVFEVALSHEDRLQVLEIPAATEQDGLLATLTAAELSVARLAVAGHSNQAIARLRRTSDRTIANQIAAVLRKLGLRSRFELAAHVAPA